MKNTSLKSFYLFPLIYFTWANTLVAIPNPILNINIELPPLLTNGKGTPVIGIEAVTPPIFTTDWTTNKLANPIQYIAANVLRDFVPAIITRHISAVKSPITNNTPTRPSSSAIIAKIKSVCASGNYPSFCLEFPNPLPNSPPLPKAI